MLKSERGSSKSYHLNPGANDLSSAMETLNASRGRRLDTDGGKQTFGTGMEPD